ncbi:MAG: phosphotransferase, partial [Actinomycetota bacterium]|nr:phosphotransferase [Actinomycetota bacterium]MDQ2980984.1 phosphotransferase [Actinomycetota bacterium]
LPLHAWPDEAAALLASARTIAAIRPDLGPVASELAGRVIEGLEGLELEPATAHGDFYDDQTLIAGGEAVLLDLDEVRATHPLLDVGNFLAHLTARGADEEGRLAFLEGYGRPANEEVALFEAAGLLKLSVKPFRRLDPDWPEEVERLLGLARARFGHYRPRLRAASISRPMDPALPQLEVLCDPDAAARELEREVFQEPVDVRAVHVVRHKPGRRCTLRYDLTLGDADAERPERVYAKTYADKRAPRVYRTLQALALARVWGPEVAIPEPVGLIPALKLVVQREVEGVPLRQAELGKDEALPRRIAEMLHTFHSSGVELERRHSLWRELDVLQRRVEELAGACPRLAGPARRCLGLAQHASAEPSAWRWQPIHRDFYDGQILVNEGGLGLLDLDDAAMAEPAVDVANFVAHLRLLALEEPGRAESVQAFAEEFFRRSRELDPSLDPRLLRLLEGGTLLRLAAIHLPRRRGEWLAERLLEQSEELLVGMQKPPPKRVHPGGKRRHNGLRLELALDGEAVLPLVAEAVASSRGARPKTCRPSLITAEEGHAVVRYELENGRGSHVLIGKWFADGRSAFVADLLAGLRQHGFDNGSYAVPEPLLVLPAVGAVFMEQAEGPCLRDVLEEDQTVARRAGAWLARFHNCDLPLRRAQGPREHAEQVLRWGIDPLLRPLCAKLAPLLSDQPNPGVRLHYDFKLTDVLVPSGGPTTVVDFDDAGVGDPSLDLASFEAMLTMSGLRRGDPGAFAPARDAFRAGYSERAPLPDRSPPVEAFVWLRLARKCLKRGAPERVWSFALEQSERSLKGEPLL